MTEFAYDTPCPYCGTMLDKCDFENGGIAGTPYPVKHTEYTCRERVVACLREVNIEELVQIRIEVERLKVALTACEDALMSSAPQSWAAGTNMYDRACRWERTAGAAIALALALARAALGKETP